ncbi:hypothetical protein [Spirosoma arcticum]
MSRFSVSISANIPSVTTNCLPNDFTVASLTEAAPSCSLPPTAEVIVEFVAQEWRYLLWFHHQGPVFGQRLQQHADAHQTRFARPVGAAQPGQPRSMANDTPFWALTAPADHSLL